MPTKEELRLRTLMQRGLTRTQDEGTGLHHLISNSVDKTPLMLYIEGVMGERIERILLRQMSTRRLAAWLTATIHKPVSYGAIIKWRKQFKINRVQR